MLYVIAIVGISFSLAAVGVLVVGEWTDHRKRIGLQPIPLRKGPR
jgi:hypothetical protein